VQPSRTQNARLLQQIGNSSVNKPPASAAIDLD
jgi:hypothetical protein